MLVTIERLTGYGPLTLLSAFRLLYKGSRSIHRLGLVFCLDPSQPPKGRTDKMASSNMQDEIKPPATIESRDVEKSMPSEAEKPDGAPIVVSDKLARQLSARQVQMIAIAGTIGTGLFLGTGKSLATGGPASMLISYSIVGAIVFITMLSLGEMATFVPIAGSFCTYAG